MVALRRGRGSAYRIMKDMRRSLLLLMFLNPVGLDVFRSLRDIRNVRSLGDAAGPGLAFQE